MTPSIVNSPVSAGSNRLDVPKKHQPSRPVAGDSSRVARQKQPGRKPVSRAPDSKAYGRSRITNGALLPDIVDGRSPWVRRAKDVIAAHLSDLGGEVATSEAERSIIRRAAILTVELERLEAKFALAGEAGTADLDLYQRTAGNLRRLLEAVGLERRPRDVDILPDPLTYARMQEELPE